VLAPVALRQAALEKRHPGWVPRRLDEELDAVTAEFPDRPYVITDERTLTYAQVQDLSIQVARGLVAAGVRPGEHVAMVMANYPEFVAVRFGISRAGAVCIPINFLNRGAELGYLLRQSQAVLLVTMDRFRKLDYLKMLDELAPGWETDGGGTTLPDLRRVVVFPTSADGGRAGAHTLDGLLSGDGEFVAVTTVSPDATADILYTSGTTGAPKGVLLTHDMLLRTAYASALSRGFQDGRRVTFSLPMYHVYGYVEGMLAVLFVGGAIIPQLSFTALATLDAITTHLADDALFIPTMTLAILDELESAPHGLGQLSSVISSGGVAPLDIWDRIDATMGPLELTTGYGMSETTASSTVTRPDDPRKMRLLTNGRLRDAGIAGDPALGGRLTTYRVVDQHTRAVLADGEIGELQVRGPGVTSGYWNKPEETAAAFTADGWLQTGDLGRLEDDYLTLVGRAKDCYRCGGEQVMPKEIEDVLSAHPAVEQAHVVALPDVRMGEVGVAWIVLRSGRTVEPQELIDYSMERLARFKVPKHFLTIDVSDIPVTPSGRPRKFLLAERAAQLLLVQ